MSLLKILFFDIETAPAISYTWRPNMEFIPMEMLKEPPFLIGWGAKWATDKQVRYGFVNEYEAIDRDDGSVVADLADLVRNADVIVGHNVNKFDLPILNARVMHHRLEPLGPVRTIDTLTLSRKNFGLPYHKLDYLGEYLGLGRKIKTDFDLWRQCMEGNVDALNKMRRYNRQDVLLLEKIFEVMKPYVRNMGRLFRANHELERACPFCGSGFETMMIRGYYDTQGSTMVKFRCDVCGKYSRARTTERHLKLGVHPL